MLSAFRRASWRPFGKFSLKMRHHIASIVPVYAALLFSHPAFAQFSQQGPKLVGTGAVGNALQGNSVSLSADGDTAIVGGLADNNSAGAAWVWTRSGGVWTQQGPKLVGSGAVGVAAQGVSVFLSADGNTAIVGGWGDNNSAGAAWVWTRSGGVWIQQGPKLVGSGAVGNAQQGVSVALSVDGNTAIVVGSHDNDYAGAAWVWTRSGGVWTQQGPKLVGSGAVGNTQQYDSVSLSADGNTAIVGGNADDDFAGAAWVWTRSGGAWTQQGPKLAGSGAVGNAQQGVSVFLSADGNTAIVGGNGDNPFVGAAWVWTRSGGVWTQQGTKLVGSDAAWNANQGKSVSLSADGNTAIVGGFGDNSGAGATWVWTRSGGVWTQQGPKLAGSGAVGTLNFPVQQGKSVSLSADGSTAIVGGWGDNNWVGAAWVFASAGATPTLTAALSANPASGTAPLSTTLTATAGGTATGTVNYTFWWNCSDAGTSVSTVTVACGDPTNATFGAKFDSVNGATQTASTTYAAPGTYSAKVIIERGSAPPAEQRTSITATSPVSPAPTVGAVSPSSGPTAGGTAVTVRGANFVAGATVTIGGTAATVASVTATTITATTPAHAAGAANVVVRNPDGQTGTLTGGFTFSDTPPVQTPPDRGDLPEDSGSWPTPATKAVVITHGWKDAAGGWVMEMATKVCNRLGASSVVSSSQGKPLTKMCQANNWDVWILDWWSKAATVGPWNAFDNAVAVGENLASELGANSYSPVHLIAHSAGANVIHSATIALKANRPAIEVHETFLDAYDPQQNSTNYGKKADWTDNYVDTRDVAAMFGVNALDGTRLFLSNGYNVDVTPPTSDGDPCMALYDPVHPINSMGIVFGCRHNRPYRFYGVSVDPSFVGDAASKAFDPIAVNGTGAMGFPLSAENGKSLSTLNYLYPKWGTCAMDGGTCVPGSPPIPSAWSAFFAGVETAVDATVGAVDYVVGIGATVLNSLRLGAISLLPGSVTPGRMAPSATPTESPSWITVQVTTTQPVNILRFDWRFAAAGEGFLRVFVDDVLVREIDQRHVSLASLTTEQIYIGGGTGTLAPGSHRIAFRLDGFGTSASGVELTGVELGLTAAVNAGLFYTLTPCRVLDTRNQTGTLGAPPLQPGATRTFDPSASPCGIPADAFAISANLTVTNVGAPGELVVFPADVLQPNASALSFRAGRTRANNAIVSFSKSSTTFSLFNNSAATVDFILDVNGFFR
jgi:hypothetical protein